MKIELIGEKNHYFVVLHNCVNIEFDVILIKMFWQTFNSFFQTMIWLYPCPSLVWVSFCMSQPDFFFLLHTSLKVLPHSWITYEKIMPQRKKNKERDVTPFGVLATLKRWIYCVDLPIVIVALNWQRTRC